VALRHSLLEHARHPSAPVIGYAPDLVTILRVRSTLPSLFRLQRWTELNPFVRRGRRGSGVLPCMG
jgi:hypothetical protein